MNALAPVPDFYTPPDAPRLHRFTLDDVIVMREAGVIHPDAKVELLDGEIIDMGSEGELHADFVIALNRFLVLGLPSKVVVPGNRLSLAPKDAPVPDLYVMEEGAPLVLTPSSAVALVIEVSDSSLSQDIGRKAIKYGSYGVFEYWVVDVRHEMTHVHSLPLAGGYAERRAVSFDQPLKPVRLPELELVIADLPRLNLTQPPA